MQRPPVLVFAQSGRFIAEAAARAGYPVRVADCFADSDTRSVAEAVIRLPPLNELTENQLLQTLCSLSQNQPCLLIYGTGIERFYPILSQLPAHIEVIGNSAHTLALLREPQTFFKLLDSLQLPYPPTSLTRAPSLNPLRKRLDSAGGTAVSADNAPLKPGEFYQQRMEGETRSVCFIADGEKPRILGWNRQINQAGQFVLQQIWQQNQPPAHAAQLITLLEKLVKASKLKGLNSLDYIVSSDKAIYILEVNPRISASVELLSEADWLQWHIDWCRGHSPAEITQNSENQQVRLLHICFAEKDYEVVDSPNWPAACHDLPEACSLIRKGQPICSVMVAADTEHACIKQLNDCQQKLLKNCLKQA